MSCCDAPAWVRQFDQKTALRNLRDYRKHGPAATTRALIDGLVRAGVEQRTLLDIGGGVGAIQYELLDAGAREAGSVEVAAAYLDAAKSETEGRGARRRARVHRGAARGAAGRRGRRGRVRFDRGTFVELAPPLPATDIVTLDRVVCCYARM